MKNSNHCQSSPLVRRCAILGRSLAGLLLALALAPLLGMAQSAFPPGYVSYQGFLTDANGVPLATNSPKNYDLNFRLYPSASGTNAVWGEIQTVTVDRGYFSVLLGQGAALTTGEPWSNNLAAYFNGPNASDRYVGITVPSVTTTEIQPRLRLLSSPYSFLSQSATALVGSSGTNLVTTANNSVAIGGNGLAVTGPVTAPSFVGSGASLTGLTAGQIPTLDISKISGNVPDSKLSANVALRAGGNSFTGDQNVGGDGGGPVAGSPANLNVIGNMKLSVPFGPISPAALNFVNFNGIGGGAIGLPTAVGNYSSDAAGDYKDLVFRVNSGKLLLQSGSGASAICITKDNNVGIGTGATQTRAKLVVNGTGVNPLPGGFYYTYAVGGSALAFSIATLSTDSSCSIYASGNVDATAFSALSDERIKNIKARSDSKADLATLKQIEITDYTYKDVLAKGNAPVKKVIGQQVEKVYPQAVSLRTDTVPDIFKPASIKDGWVTLATSLKAGDRVKLMGETAEGVYEVLEVQNDRFRTEFKQAGEKIFVYGREVKDFRTVDYEAIAMLNVSATQELVKRLEKLEARETHLAQLEQQASRVETLEQEVTELKKLVAQLAQTGKETKETAMAPAQSVPSAASITESSAIARR